MHKKEALSATFIISFFDGLTLPPVIITVLVRLGNDSARIINISAAIVALYATVMGISTYFTRRTHRQTKIKAGTFQNIGLSGEMEDQLLEDHEQEKQEWEKVLHENKFPANEGALPSIVAAIGYLLAGAALLASFLFLNVKDAWIVSCTICGILILLFGILKAGVTGNTALRVVSRGLFYAGVLSGMAYWLVGLLTK